MVQILETLTRVAESLELRIVRTYQVSSDLLEVIVAHKDSSEHVDLDAVSEAASAFAEAIDYEIGLDVSSEGAESEIKDDAYESVIGEFVYVQFINPVKNEEFLEGILVAVNDSNIVVKIRVKHAQKDFTVERNNIALLRLAVKL